MWRAAVGRRTLEHSLLGDGITAGASCRLCPQVHLLFGAPVADSVKLEASRGASPLAPHNRIAVSRLREDRSEPCGGNGGGVVAVEDFRCGLSLVYVQECCLIKRRKLMLNKT